MTQNERKFDCYIILQLHSVSLTLINLNQSATMKGNTKYNKVSYLQRRHCILFVFTNTCIKSDGSLVEKLCPPSASSEHKNTYRTHGIFVIQKRDINDCVFLTFLLMFVQLFKLTRSGTAEMVAPGLSLSGVLEFLPEKNEEVRDCLMVRVDDADTIEIPLLG